MKYIEGGWQSYLNTCIPADAPEVQRRECRQAFFAGAAVLFQSIMATLDGGSEPTANDLNRMSDIQTEPDAFGQELDKRAFGAQEH